MVIVLRVDYLLAVGDWSVPGLVIESVGVVCFNRPLVEMDQRLVLKLLYYKL